MSDERYAGRRGGRLSSIVIHGSLLTASAFFVFPIVWMVLTSLKTLREVNEYPPMLLPAALQLQNYPRVFEQMPFGQYTWNSAVVAAFVVIGTVVSCSLVAYAFARLRFPGRDALFALVLATLILPDIIKLVPMYLMFKQFGWINTLLPLIVPAFFGNAFFIFLLRQFFRGIPRELSEAARIDGASELRILWSIVAPLAKPAITVVALFAFQASWNEFLWPLVFLQNESVKTLPLALYSFKSLPTLGTSYHEMMAAAVIVTIPMLVAFALFQRHFVKGVTLGGGIKG